MVVDAVLETKEIPDGPDKDYYDEDEELGSIVIHKVPTGTIGDSVFVEGAVFEKMLFSCDGELALRNPKILLLDINLDDTKAHKEIDKIIRLAEKLYKKHCATIVLSCRAVGDSVTKLLASKNIVCAGLVAEDDMDRIKDVTRGTVMTALNNYINQALGTCELFEQKQIGDRVFSIFSGCPSSRATIVLHGADHQFLAEVEQILHNKIIFVKSAVRKNTVTTSRDVYDLSTELNVDNAEQKHALAAVNISDSVYWEPSIVKIDALKIGTIFATTLL